MHLAICRQIDDIINPFVMLPYWRRLWHHKLFCYDDVIILKLDKSKQVSTSSFFSSLLKHQNDNKQLHHLVDFFRLATTVAFPRPLDRGEISLLVQTNYSAANQRLAQSTCIKSIPTLDRIRGPALWVLYIIFFKQVEVRNISIQSYFTTKKILCAKV